MLTSKVYWPILFLFLCVSCQKDASTIEPEAVSGGILSVKINGRNYTAEEVTATVLILESLNAKFLLIQAPYSPNLETVLIGLNIIPTDISTSCLPVGEYTSEGAEDLSISYALGVESYLQLSAKLTILECNEDKKTLSGTFAAELDEGIQLTSGEFKNLTYTVERN